MRCLLIDNYDSFTYILADYIGQTFGDLPTVVYNDQFSWTELTQHHQFDCIVVSPGPGSVVKPEDFRLSRDAVAQNDIPVFGVCLGLQGINHQHGGLIQYCPEPFHGRLSSVNHNDDPMFAHIPSQFDVVRYHSLMIGLPTSGELIATAKSSDGVIQALRHRSLPKWGVQFHPESILTEHGHQILTNFRDLSHQHLDKTLVSVPSELKPSAPSPVESNTINTKHIVSKKLQLKHQPQAIFNSLFASKPHSFWLDSQSADQGCGSRFSFMGCVDEDNTFSYQMNIDNNSFSEGHNLLNQMDRLLSDNKVVGGEVLPFGFVGGLMGYFSYEMKALFGAKHQHDNPIPDMVWMQVDHFLAIDHHTDEIYLVVCADEADIDDANLWLDDIEHKLADITACQPVSRNLLYTLDIALDAGKEAYIEAIKRCKSAIVEGDSYEVCLTNQFSFAAKLNPLDLYMQMREGNAAPFGAYIQSAGTSLLSTSPERFLEVSSQGRIQAKPIKGTMARSAEPAKDKALARQLANSEKDRSENLMIVDLMRNDLSRVSKPASVRVPTLMDIESYKTVHQMVSTIESQLADENSLMDLIKVTFPGGSITGAPKLRTMEIIDGLEKSARGPYCGAIGYLGYNRVADLNIGIRTLSYDGDKVRFGAGGAITHLSDDQAEFDEIMLKAEALIKPLWDYLSGGKSMAAHLEADHLHITTKEGEKP